MKRLLSYAACVFVLSGCVTSLGVRVGNTGAPATQPSVGPGASTGSAGISAHISDASTLGAIIGIGVISAMFGGDRSAPAELDPARKVHEQDCTRPLEVPEANLRCR